MAKIEKIICSLCLKNIRTNAKAVQCDLCNHWVHKDCNFISIKRYNEINEPNNNSNFECSKCLNSILPFGNTNDNVFSQTNTLGLNDESNLENLHFNLSKKEKKIN